MARKPVTMAIAEEDLLKLDEFRKARRLDRGDAVGMLLEMVEKGGPVIRGPEYFADRQAHSEKKGNPIPPPSHVGGEILPQLRTPEEKIRALEEARGLLANPVKVDLRSYYEGEEAPVPERIIDWSGDQSTPTDYDQTRKRGR